MDLNDVLVAVRARRRWIVGGLVAGLLAAALLSWTAERTYSSTTQFFVSVTGTRDQTEPLDADSFVQQRMTTYVQVLTGGEMAQDVIDDLRLPVSPRDLEAKISATPLPGTVILQVEVTDSSPEGARAVAESLGRHFASRVSELETPQGATTPNVAIETLQPPDLDPKPVSPGVRRNIALGGALGLLLGIGLALLRSRMDRTVRREDHIREAVGAEVIGRVPEDRVLTTAHVAPDLDGESPTAEAYRGIRVHLRHVDGGPAPRVVVVTSALPDEGASTVAIHLSSSLARSDSRVLLVDANTRRPRVTRYLGLRDDGPGLTDVLAGTADLTEATQTWGDGRLTVLGPGLLPADPDAMLDSARLRALVQALRNSYEFVVVDAPPLLSVVDAAALSALADGCLLVTRMGWTTQDDLAEAATTLEQVHARLLGVVLNRVPPRQAARRGARNYPADPDRTASETDARIRRNGRRGSHSAGRVPAAARGQSEA